MYTKESLNQFVNWLEENLEIDDDEKQVVASGVLYSLPKPHIDFNNLPTQQIINLFRLKIREAKFDKLGICKKEHEPVIFAGLERWRKKYETALKHAKKEGAKRVSGWY